MTDKLPSDERVEILELARQMDWQQVVLNGGPPCFAVDEYVDRFCGRAERWHQDGTHKFVSLADLLSSAVALAKAGMREAAAQACRKSLEAQWEFDSDDMDAKMPSDYLHPVEAIRALPDSAADEALARFKADAVREARIEEAKWWHDKVVWAQVKPTADEQNQRIVELERKP